MEANSRAPTDQYFRYSISYEPRSTTELLGMLDLHVEELPGAVGDRLGQLDDNSRYARTLDKLSPNDVHSSDSLTTRYAAPYPAADPHIGNRG